MQLLRRISQQLLKRYKLRPWASFPTQHVKSFNRSISCYPMSNVMRMRRHHEENYSEENEEVFGSENEEALQNYLNEEQPIAVKDLLYPDSNDPLIENIKAASSVQEVLDFLHKYSNILTHKHLAQIVLVLWDLQKMFYHINYITHDSKFNALINDYISQLLHQPQITHLLSLIEENCTQFDLESITATFLYLNRIGLKIKHPTMQSLNIEINEKFKNGEFSLNAASRFIVSVFQEFNLGSYLQCKQIIPKVYSYIDRCETAEEVKLISMCLNNLNKVVGNDVMEGYKRKVEALLSDGRISKIDTSTLLKIILFLNYPQWRNENVKLISRCLMLLENGLGRLNVHQLLNVYEVVNKIQEPAVLLNEIQRCACKYMHKLESESNELINVRLRLLSCIVCFSPASQRPQFENIVRKYLDYTLTGENLLELCKVLTFIKISDPFICKSFWDKLLNVMEHDANFKDIYLLRVSYSYVNFNQTVGHRNLKFEKRLNQWLEGEIETGIAKLLPSKFTAIACFTIAYGKDISILNYVLNKLTENIDQLNYIHCLNLAKSLETGLELTRNPILKPRYLKSLNAILDKIIEREANGPLSINKINLLLKSCLHRNQEYGDTVSNLLEKYRNFHVMSSKLMKTLTFCLHSTNTLMPEVIDRMVDYVCECPDNVMAFNAEKVAYLCYYFGYWPQNAERFSQVLSDILIRDQERLAGLSYLQSTLALTFFNRLTDTFVKQIFNTSFLEKLDAELHNCYSKDVYPSRVRNRLMQLNRVVCIDHPEANVPWFHQKYVEEIRKKAQSESVHEHQFTHRVKGYLQKIFQDPKSIMSHVMTPYGYHIDYVVQLEQQQTHDKYAVLLLRPKAFTKGHVQLKGPYQTKIRHLEMFGYQVAYIRFNEWKDLIYGEEKINYLKKLFIPNLHEINR